MLIINATFLGFYQWKPSLFILTFFIVWTLLSPFFIVIAKYIVAITQYYKYNLPQLRDASWLQDY